MNSVFRSGIYSIGCFSGVCLVILFEFFSDFFGAGFEPSEALVAGIFGALIALAGTILTISVAHENVKEERFRRQKSLLFGAFVKFSQITSNALTIRKALRESYARIPSDDSHNPAKYVQSLAGLPENVEFSAEERAIFLELNEHSIANEIMQWGEVHNTLIAQLRLYGELRGRFLEGIPATMDGLLGSVTLSPQQYVVLAPKLAQLNELIQGLMERAEYDAGQAVLVMKQLLLIIEKHAGKKLEMEFPET